ncbi:MAG: hypothetical protein BYD32DRAFT_117470 [Podila humilis]|nr:MAG: hypothetical protein BYD32DRAFT_117470 [Podila humilis]
MAQALSISLALQPALFHSTPSSSTSACISGAHTPSPSSILHLSRKSSSLSLSASFPRSSSEPSLFLPRFRSRAGATAATFIAPTTSSNTSTTDLHVRAETLATRASHRSPLSSCTSGEHLNNNNDNNNNATNSIIADSHAPESTFVLDTIELSAPSSGISSSLALSSLSTSSSSPTRSSSSLRRHSHSEVFAHSASHSEPIPPSPHQPYTQAADPSSVLRKVYTRVKHIVEKQPNKQQLEKTMTDYWHSFAAPQPRDLEEHLPSTDIFIPSSVVSTSSTISTPSASTSSSSQKTIVETGSLLKSSVRSASEQGLLLAQRSKTSLNRLLDTVLDNATTLAESSSANCAYSDSEDKPSLPTATPAPRTAPSQPRQPARAKFFVCDSDEESEDEEKEEEEAYFFPRRSEDNFGDCEDSGTDEAEAEEEGPVMRAPTTNTSSLQSVPGMVRRQSLLSDLFMAEKQREQFQQPSKPIRPSMARTCSTYSSRCPSAANSDSETTFSRMAPVPEVYQDRGHHRHHQHYPHNTNLDAENEIQEPEKSKSPLIRTKRVFKNLDELASLSTSPTYNISSPSSASSTSSIVSTSTALAAWTRSHQVQVQIQSLVVQSTSSAQRALLSASATLTDVLFRTK